MPRNVVKRTCKACGRTKRLDTSFPRSGLYFRRVCSDCWNQSKRDYRRKIAGIVNAARTAGLA